MDTTDIHPLQQAAELRLLADALELQHLTSTEASIRPIPMVRGEKAQRFIVIGAAAEVERLLEIAGARSAQAAPIQASSRDEVLEEAAKLCEIIESDRFDAYKGRGKHESFGASRGDVYVNGESDGAGQCAQAIRALKAEAPSKSSDSKGGEQA